jgi:alkaline phosphatase
MKRLLVLSIFLFFSIITGQNPTKPKNIILLIGDGMGIPQVSASVLSMENDPFKKFKNIGLVNTCSADKLVTDSAAGATAFAAGKRTLNNRLGIDIEGNNLENIFEIAKKKKKSTGVVVTCSITNATPAAFMVHIDSRYKQFEIAEQIAKSNTDILIGAGTQYFLPKSIGGKRDDEKNIADTMKSLGYHVITDSTQIYNLPDKNKLLALLGSYQLPKGEDRNYNLGELTKHAIKSLNKNNKGFVLMIEGSRIDWAGEANDRDYFYSEQIDFNNAINAALDFASKDKNTLVIVLADHDTGAMGIKTRGTDSEKLGMVWGTKTHTANLIATFSFGPASNKFIGILENWEVGKKLIELVK